MWNLSSPLLKEIYKYANYHPIGVSLRQMVNFGSNPSIGSLFKASQFMVQELPIRLAQRVKDLDTLPNNLNKAPSIIQVKNWYAQSFEELRSIPKPIINNEMRKLLYNEKNFDEQNISDYKTTNNDYNLSYMDDGLKIRKSSFRRDYDQRHSDENVSAAETSIIKKYYSAVPADVNWPSEIIDYNRIVTDALVKIKRRHDPTVATIAKGLLEWKVTQPDSNAIMNSSIQSFLDRFYMSRIGIRMLLGQHIAMSSGGIAGNDDFVGIICKKTNVKEIALDAAENARFICEQYYHLYEAPKVEIYCDSDIEFMYVPSHLMHMIFEILKNSLRATVESQICKQGDKFDIYETKFPPIKVIIAEGNEDITIKISDEGGGIPRSAIPHIWAYLYTTAKTIPDLESNDDFVAPMAGLGYGLSLSRLYARYFGGDLKLISMEGYGTDAYLHLNKLGSSSEPLP